MTGNPVARSFPARPEDLYRIREFVREQGRGVAIPGPILDEITLAVSEACANSALHSRSLEVTVRWRAAPDHVEVTVDDEGVFARRVKFPGMNGLEGGRGIPIMMALMDEITIREGREHAPGTSVRLVKYAS